MSESKTNKLGRLQKRKQEIENTIKDLTARDKENNEKLG